jgi:hypothetical protein
VHQTAQQVKQLEATLHKMDTRAVSTVNAVSESKTKATEKRAKSVSELHRPRGPMPVSILVKSDNDSEGLPPGTDITSRIKRRKVDPCEAPCTRLGDCALDSKLCPKMNTRQHDKAIDVCRRACRSSKAMAHAIIGSTDCRGSVIMASQRVDGFASLCGGDK